MRNWDDRCFFEWFTCRDFKKIIWKYIICLDKKIKTLLDFGFILLAPFFSFGLGFGIKLTNVVATGFLNIFLVIGGVPMF